jgi:hypothetical protein
MSPELILPVAVDKHGNSTLPVTYEGVCRRKAK